MLCVFSVDISGLNLVLLGVLVLFISMFILLVCVMMVIWVVGLMFRWLWMLCRFLSFCVVVLLKW